MPIWEQLLRRSSLSEKDRLLQNAITVIVGRKPKNLGLYKLATLHSSVAKISKRGYKESNERLEYLGDSVLNMVIAEYLFKKYPYQHEGFLTEIRSRIVKRDSLNSVARKLGIHKIVETQEMAGKTKNKSIFGNALEAVIGAVFLDRGYPFCKQFILQKIVSDHLDMEKIIRTNPNHKSKIIEWAQKEGKDLMFELISEVANPPHSEFTIGLFIDGEEIAKGIGSSKKRAEQDASLKAWQTLKLP